MALLRPLVRVRSVEPLEHYRVRLAFEDGTQREVDLAVYLRGPIFEPIRNDPTVFRSMYVVGGTVAWPNGADIDPDVLYYGLRPAWMEEGRAQAKPAHGTCRQISTGVVVHEPAAQYAEAPEEDELAS